MAPTNNCRKQECIPVGCVLPALYHTGASLSKGGGGLSPEGGGRFFPGGFSLSLLGGQTPPRGQTDACENITLPQTSFADGNKKVSLHVEKVNAKASSLPNENVLFVYTGEKATSLPDGFMGNLIECSR